MRKFFRARRVVAVAMIVGFVVALFIGLWPVQANVFGDPSYSCGSGFIHSAGDWAVDSAALQNVRTGDDTGTSLPISACPDKVNARRDFALLVMAFSLAIGLLSTLFLDRSREPNFKSTMYANRRRGPARAPIPVRRPAPSEESSVK